MKRKREAALDKIAQSELTHTRQSLAAWFKKIFEEAILDSYSGKPTPEKVDPFPAPKESPLPCPLCGDESKYHQENYGRGSMGAEPDCGFISCSCGARGPTFYMYYDTGNQDSANRLKTLAIKAWNRRSNNEPKDG